MFLDLEEGRMAAKSGRWGKEKPLAAEYLLDAEDSSLSLTFPLLAQAKKKNRESLS